MNKFLARPDLERQLGSCNRGSKEQMREVHKKERTCSLPGGSQS